MFDRIVTGIFGKELRVMPILRKVRKEVRLWWFSRMCRRSWREFGGWRIYGLRGLGCEDEPVKLKLLTKA